MISYLVEARDFFEEQKAATLIFEFGIYLWQRIIYIVLHNKFKTLRKATVPSAALVKQFFLFQNGNVDYHKCLIALYIL